MEDKKIIKIENIFEKEALDFINSTLFVINEILQDYDKIDFSNLKVNGINIIDSIERIPTLYDLEYNNLNSSNKEVIMGSKEYNNNFKIILNKRINNEKTE